MRDDIAIDKNSANEILENAPEKELDFFSVPKVIEWRKWKMILIC